MTFLKIIELINLLLTSSLTASFWLFPLNYVFEIETQCDKDPQLPDKESVKALRHNSA